jgi:hypothetical protein
VRGQNEQQASFRPYVTPEFPHRPPRIVSWANIGARRKWLS